MPQADKARPGSGRIQLRIAVVALVLVAIATITYRAATRNPSVARVAVLQLVSHPSLDNIRIGIVQAITDAEPELGRTVSFDIQNAHGDIKLVKTIADKFAGADYDLIIPITTPAAQAVVNADRETPIVFGAVTDPVGAGILESLTHPGGNVTGVSDLWPIERQIDFALSLVPSARSIGTVYNPGEANSQTIIKLIRDACQEKGVTLHEATVAQGSEVLAATQSLVGKTDLIYTAADSTVGAAYESVLKVARENTIPVFAGDGDSVKRGAVGTLGLDYTNVGKLTGQLAVRILRGDSPAKTPVVLVTDTTPMINLAAADFFGVVIPEELRASAEIVGDTENP